ncbi:MAG TPA: hypothetical protein VHD32_09210 [Candidatus Didemnitutus sp.]|nr:hypothetical protein [Candidatus Didemnitutus sp.]
MFVARFLEVVIPVMLVGVGLGMVIRLARGTPEAAERKRWLHSTAVWRTFVQVLLVVAVYFFLTRFFR